MDRSKSILDKATSSDQTKSDEMKEVNQRGTQGKKTCGIQILSVRFFFLA